MKLVGETVGSGQRAQIDAMQTTADTFRTGLCRYEEKIPLLLSLQYFCSLVLMRFNAFLLLIKTLKKLLRMYVIHSCLVTGLCRDLSVQRFKKKYSNYSVFDFQNQFSVVLMCLKKFLFLMNKLQQLLRMYILIHLLLVHV